MTTQVDPKGLFARISGRLRRSGSKADKRIVLATCQWHEGCNHFVPIGETVCIPHYKAWLRLSQRLPQTGADDE